MIHFKLLVPRAMWLGTIGIATMLLGTPSCKAQEATPVRFTDAGVEDVYPAKTPAKQPVKALVAARYTQAGPSKQADGRKQNTPRAARKRNVVISAPGK